MFSLNQTVRVVDPINFYRGRVGSIADVATFGDVTVYTVHVPSSTGNAVISFAARNEHLESVE